MLERKLNFDWNLLRTFVVIMQKQSISRAAVALNLTQPAVSTALQRLEMQLGHQLIRRGGTLFEVTPQGAILYSESLEVLSKISRLHDRLVDADKEVAGVVRLSLASHVVSPLLDHVLREFHDVHPNIRYEIEVGKSTRILEEIAGGALTAGICLVYQRSEKLEYRRLLTEHFGLFCGRNHRLFGQSGLEVADILEECMVSFQTDQLNDSLWPVAQMRNELRMTGKIVGVSPNLEEVRRMIMAGLGIGPLPIHAVDDEVVHEVLWRLPPYDNLPAIDVFVVTNPRSKFSRAESLFLQHLFAALSVDPVATDKPEGQGRTRLLSDK